MKYKFQILFLLSILIFSFGCIDNLFRGSANVEEGSYSSPGYDMDLKSPVATPEMEYDEDSKIIKSGSINIEVQSNTIESKYDELISKLNSKNVEIVDLQYNEYTSEKRYTLTIKVSPNEFDSIISEVKTLGDIKSANTNIEDVTEQYIDIERRISHKEIQLNRLYELYNQTGTVTELLELEREISRVEYELESLVATKLSYDKKITKSTIVIYLTEKKFESELSLTDTFSGLMPLFLTTLSFGLMFLVGSIGFVIPFLIIVVLIKLIWDYTSKTTKKPPKKK
jgi:hypothetical protein